MKYNVTYTTVDQKVRNYVWDMSKAFMDDEYDIDFETVSKFIQTKQWPADMSNEETYHADWGLNPVDPENIIHHRPIGQRTIYASQFETHRLAMFVALDLAWNCLEDQELYETIFRVATEKAAARDGIAVADATPDREIGHVGALNKEKYGAEENARFGHVSDKAMFHAALNIKTVIEEYELFSLLDIKKM